MSKARWPPSKGHPKVTMKPLRGARPALALVALAVGLAACGGGDDTTSAQPGSGSSLRGTVKIDGSSTVAPLSEKAAEDFQRQNKGVQVTVGTSGTGGGFEKFCRGEIDISDASRPIKDSEKQACEAAGIRYAELQVANDGLAVVLNNDNNWANCLTTQQLKAIWDQGSKVNNWNQVDPSFPNEPMRLFGAGTDSGTFDYCTEAINGKSGQSRRDYQATEDDNVTVQGVAGSKGGLGYFGLSYLKENASKVKGVEIDGGSGCVAPSDQSVQSQTYKPLGRPLFIYPSAAALRRPEVKAFVDFYITESKAIAQQSKFVALTDAQLSQSREKVARLTSATG